MATKSIPEGHHSIVPHLSVSNGAKAIEFYKAAFGARENFRSAGPDGKIMHADLSIGDGRFFLSDEYGPPSTPGGVTIHLWSAEASAFFERATKAGAKVKMPMADMFWGDRYGQLTDPFGHTWAIAQHLEDLTPEEMQKRGQAFFAQMKK